MAVKDCLELSNILATWLITWDDNLAKLIAEISSTKNRWSKIADMFSKTVWDEAEKIATSWSLMADAADTQLRAIVYAKILSWDTSRDAYIELSKLMKNKWWTIAKWLQLNELINNARPADYADIVRLMWIWEIEDWDITSTLKTIQDKLNTFSWANYSFDELSNFNKWWILADTRVKFKNWEITKEEFIKTIRDTWETATWKKKQKSAKKAKTWWEAEKSKLQAPKWIVNIDKEWYTILKIADWNEEEAMKLWWNYCVARAMLADSAVEDDVIQAFIKWFDWVELNNLWWELTVDTLEKIDSLDVLMSKAFTNTKDLAYDWELRLMFWQKLRQLASSWELSYKDVEKLNSLVNTTKFVEDWAAFTYIAKCDAAIQWAKQIWLNVKYTNWKKLYEWILDAVRNLDIKNIPDKFNIANCVMDSKDLITLIFKITWDNNIANLFRAWVIDDNSVLWIATSVLLWDRQYENNILALVKKANQQNSITNTKAISIRAITWVDIWDDLPIKYFNFRDWLYEVDKATSAKSEFMNQLADRNKMVIDWVDIIPSKNISEETLISELQWLVVDWKWWYLLVNDSQWRTNPTLVKALDEVNRTLDYEDKIIVAYPRWGMMWQIINEWWEVVFKTTNDTMFNDIAWTISIQTLWQSTPTRNMIALQNEIKTWRNSDKLRYQITYEKWAVDNLGNKLSDQQVEYHAKSKMRNANGNLVKVYRWSTRHPKEVLGKIPWWRESNHYADYWDTTVLFFSSSKNVAEWYWWEWFTRWKILKTFEDVVEEIENRDFSWFVEVTRDWDDIVLTASDDFILPWYEFNKWDELVRWTVKDIDTYLNEWDNVLTRWGLWIQYEAYLYAENPLIVDAWWNMYNHIMHNWKEYNAEQLALFAKENWYDWLIIRNVREDVRVDAADDYIVFWQNQVKWVDNKNPNIDEWWRFQEVWDKATYEKWAVDNLGNKLSDQQDNFFEESAIRTDDWTLLRIYHWTKAEFTEFDPARLWKNMADGAEERWGLSFWDWFYATSDRESAMWYSETWWSGKGRWIVMEWYVNIKKPFMWNNYKTNEAIAKLSKELWLPEWFLRKNMFIDQINKLKTVEQSVEFTEALKLAWYDWIWVKKVWGWDEIVFFDSNQFKSINNKTPTSDSNILLQRRKQDAEWLVTRDASLKLEIFRKTPNWIKTIEDVAKAYNIPIEDIDVIKSILTEKWIEAYWAYGKWIIYLWDNILEWTVAHEVFHAVFDMVDAKKYEDILNKWSKLFWKTQLEVEEELADAFASYFKTWKFELFKWEKIALRKKKTILDSIKQLFEELKNWLIKTKEYDTEITKLFDDIINVKVTPMDWELVDANEKLLEYNTNLNNSAVKYYWDMLWVNWEVVDDEYANKVYSLLSDKTGISLNSFTDIEDRWVLWKMVNDRYTIDKMTTWKYDKIHIDITWELNRIDNLNNEDFVKEVSSELWDLIDKESLSSNKNIEFIKDAYKDFMTASDEIAFLQAKWKLISLINWWEAESMSIDDVRNMFTNKTFSTTYKNIFFPNQELWTDEMNKLVKQINDNMFDLITAKFSDNIVKSWYSLPLVSSRQLVYDYLNWKLNVNNQFVQAFFYKNWIPINNDNIRVLTDELMPKNIEFDYVDAMYKQTSKLASWEWNVVREVDNRFITESYSALVALDAIDRWAVVNVWDRELLEWILDKYKEKTIELLEKWTLTFKEAQMLKQEASYALDMFEQDFLLPKYGRILTTQERQWLMWMKYSLPIAVDWLDKSKVAWEFDKIKQVLLSKYDDILSSKADDIAVSEAIVSWRKTTDKIMADRINTRKAKLIDNWQVIVKAWNDYVVVDVRQSILDTLWDLPDNIWWIWALKSATMSDLDMLSNEQAYWLLRYLEVAKNISTRATLAEEVITRHNPMLSKLNFFRNFQINKDTWLPYALWINWLINKKWLENAENLAVFDTNVKKHIFGNITNQFKSTWKWYVTNDDIKKYISDALKEYIWDLQNSFWTLWEKKFISTCTTNYYSTFTPYTFLRDIPEWWVTSNGVVLVDVKWRINDILKWQYRQAKEDLSKLNISWLDELEDKIYITLSDWQEIKLREAWDLSVDSWKEKIFWDKEAYVKWDEYITREPSKWEKYMPWYEERAQKRRDEQLKKITNSYNSTLQSIMNNSNTIDNAEKEFMTAFMYDIRRKLRQSSLTNIIVDAIDASSWVNEKASRWIKDYVIWFINKTTWWLAWEEWLMNRWNKVKEAYTEYYTKSLDELDKLKVRSEYEDCALNIAKYFKTIEWILGSIDWVKWCTTDIVANKAFYNIWEVVMNINSTRWVYTLMSWIDQQQILKFFKLSKKWQASYYDKFVQKTLEETSVVYRDYVSKIVNISRDDFNKLFWVSFSNSEYSRTLQWLTWFTLTWTRKLNRILDFINSSTWLERAFISYPFWVLTIPWQWIAYYLKQKWFEKYLWLESLSNADSIRQKFSILDWAYNEIPLYNRYWWVSPDDLNPNSMYNRYWIPDTDEVYKDLDLYSTDNITDIYAKIDKYWASSEWKMSKILTTMDSYKDNQNNIVDWVFSRNFKNLAFTKALKDNDYMSFSSANEFLKFMSRDDISKEVKDKLLERVKVYSGREFRSMLALWFWGIDRFIWWSTFWNVIIWLTNLFNFRWSWWQNVVKQFWNALYNTFVTIPNILLEWWTISKESLDNVINHIANQPEYTNFMTELFNSVWWAYRLSRYQDNWQWPDETDPYEQMSFIDAFPNLLKYTLEALELTSQQTQWIESYWPWRIIKAPVDVITAKLQWDTVYNDTAAVWAFLNALQTNVWRNWKARDWIMDALLQFEKRWWKWVQDYVYNEFWKLSAWTLRYMVWEEEWAYWYQTELSPSEWWIPSLFYWTSDTSSDKSFTYKLNDNRVWEATMLLFDNDVSFSDKKTYMWNYCTNLYNSSRLFWAGFWLAKWIIEWLHLMWADSAIWQNWTIYARSYANSEDFTKLIRKTDAWRQLNDVWYVIPNTPEDSELFFNTMIENGKYRPGSSNFTKSLINFEETWHMDWNNWKDADKYMEAWLKDMKEEWEFTWDSWKALIKDVKEKAYNQTYVVDRIYNYAKDYLERHSDSDRYNLYSTMLWQWHINNLVEITIERKYWDENETHKALLKNMWIKKQSADDKWDKTEYKNTNLRDVYLELWNTVIGNTWKTLFEIMVDSDKDKAIEAWLILVENQMKDKADKVELEQYFTVWKKETEEEWDYKQVTIASNFKNQLSQWARMAQAAKEWNQERYLAEASALSNIYMKKDPTGIITTSIIDTVYDRVYNETWFSPEQKIEIMNSLFRNNKDFIYNNVNKLKEKMWEENFKKISDFMDWTIYKWDKEIISTMEDIITSETADEEEAKKKWSSISKARELSNALKDLNLSIWWWTSSWERATINPPRIDPIKVTWSNLIRELWLKWYTPNVSKIVINAYKPKSTFDIMKDISRNFKTTKTQEVKKSKQLSSIESKTQKAIESES